MPPPAPDDGSSDEEGEGDHGYYHHAIDEHLRGGQTEGEIEKALGGNGEHVLPLDAPEHTAHEEVEITGDLGVEGIQGFEQCAGAQEDDPRLLLCPAVEMFRYS